MPWTYAELRAHIDANYAGMPDAAAAAALAAETRSAAGALMREDAVLRAIRANVWGSICVRASRAWSGTAGINAQTAAAVQVRDAILLFDRFDLSDNTLYTSLERDLNVLVGLGDVSAAVRDAILAQRDKTEPRWIPTPTIGDVQTARAQP